MIHDTSVMSIELFTIMSTVMFSLKSKCQNDRRRAAASQGATENAGVENAIRSKLQGWKMQEWKKQE